MKTNKKEVKNFRELTDFLSEKFEGVDKQFEKVNKKLDVVKGDLDFLVDTTKKGFDEAQEDRKEIRKELSKTEARIISIIKGDKERNFAFHEKVVEVLEKNKLVNKKDLDYLTALVR